LPKSDGFVARAASRVVHTILATVFGEEFATEFITFLGMFTGLFQMLNVEVNTMRDFLSGPDVAFLLVTSPAQTTLTEAHFFQDKTRELGLPFRGFVLNRSRALNIRKQMPDTSMAGTSPTPTLRSALGKLQSAAAIELELAGRDVALLRDLESRAGAQATAVALPELPQGADDMGTLVSVANVLDAS
jgi:hypothetical protein